METQNIFVKRASLADLDSIVPLFDAYRQFYEQPSNLALAWEFIRERLEREQSVIFVALRSAGSTNKSFKMKILCALADEKLG